jgi:acyl-CoA synthetase (NDP forming)
MQKIFYPDSIVVIGVSEKPDNLARVIAENLVRFNYGGDLYFVGRRKGTLAERPILTSVDELPDGVGLAIILTPAPTVPDLLEDCGRKGIRRAVIESGGFGEFSEEGRALDEQVLAIARKWGIRFVGPNCISIVNTDNGICSPFLRMAPEEIKPGRVAVLAQSGGVILTCIDLLTASGLGVSKTASVGNKLDFKEADYLEYFLSDGSTDTIFLYLESIDDGRKLVELASTAQKPVIIYKANTGQASAQIAHSHTAALANDDRVVDAAFKQFGIFRPGNFRDMVNFAKGFAMPPVRGNTLAVFSRSGGHAIIVADEANKYGFSLPPFSEEFLEKAKQYFRADVIAPINPLDMGAIFDFLSYTSIVEEGLRTMKPDAALLTFNYRSDSAQVARKVAGELKEMSRAYDTPIALCYFTEMDEIAGLEKDLGYPIFTEVDEAVKALAASRDRYLWQRREAARARQGVSEASSSADAAANARRILEQGKGRPLMIHEALEICQAYGIPVAPWAFAPDVGEALKLAERVGYPLALKVVSPDISHKSDMGGIALGIEDGRSLERACQAMLERVRSGVGPGAELAGFLLQQMVGGGREVILGGKRDRGFGPLVMFGLGGIYVEVFDDVALRVAPITPDDADSMIAEPRGSRLLRGVRGERPSDVRAVADCLLKLSRLICDLPEIEEIDINPLVVFEKGALAVDARIVLQSYLTSAPV